MQPHTPLSLFFAALIFSALISSKVHADVPRKIGIIAPLSGDVAAWGQDTRRALELSNELLGQGRFKLVFEDDKCLGKDARTAAQKLTSVDKVHFGMTVCTESTLSAAPVFEKSKTVVVAPGATGAAVSDAGEYIFRTWPSDSLLVEQVVNYIGEHYESVALLSENRGFPQEFSRIFRGLAAQKKIKVWSEDFHSNETDFRSLVVKIRNRAPQILVINTDSDRTLLEVLQQVRGLGWQVPVASNYIAATTQFLKNAGSLAEGIVLGDTQEIDCTQSTPGCKVYNEFLARYGAPQSSPFMVASSIAAFMAIESLSGVSAQGRDELYQSTIEGTPLGAIRFDAKGDVQGPGHTLRVIRDAKVTALP